jgi:hypothetical protein
MTISFGRNQGLSAQDLEYDGSSFLEVRQKLFENLYYDVWGGKFEPPLPEHKVTFLSVFWGIIPYIGTDFFSQAAQRTIDSFADLRPGKDEKGFQRMVHPNGICLTGTWEITEDSGHTGYFEKGSLGRIVSRISVGSSDTHRDGANKSFSLVGKIFPTMDKNEKVLPANFFTQSNLGATPIESVLDAQMRNTPDIQALGRGLEIAILLRTSQALGKGDRIPDERQVYSVAELGKPDDQPLRAPRFMQLKASEDNFRSIAHRDFRDEIMSYLYNPGQRYNYKQHQIADLHGNLFDYRDNAGRELVFDIEVSNSGEPTGAQANRKWAIRDWKKIGQIRFNDAAISREGDRVIHFHHDVWRDDRDDPSTSDVPLRNGKVSPFPPALG